MPVEIVSLVVGGKRWTAWTSVTLRASIKEAARSFAVEIAAEYGALAIPEVFKAGAEVKVYAGSDVYVTGYIDRKQPQFDKNTAKIGISGRGKAADLIDSAALHRTGRFEKQTVAAIGKELDTFGVGVSSDVSLDQVDYQITPGETVFRVMEKISRKQGNNLVGQADGSVKITNASKAKRHAGALIEGGNIKAGEADHNWSKRPSKVIVRGQRAIGHGPDALEIEQESKDSAVKRDRPQLVVQDDDTDKATAKKRAKNARDKSAGQALKANITVVGWRDAGGTIWEPNRLIWVESAFLDIRQDLLVETVDLMQAMSGTTARLGLVDPRAHGGKKGKGNKSGQQWDTGSDE